jgi:hypothetical protein
MALIEINWNPSTRELRQFAGIWFPALFALLGAWIWYASGAWLVPAVLVGTAVVLGGIGLVWPSFIRPVYVVWMAAVLPIGWVVSHVLLGIVYFGIMTPVGLVMRLFGYDPMQLQFDRAAPSYWVAHNPGGDTARYFRQF